MVKEQRTRKGTLNVSNTSIKAYKWQKIPSAIVCIFCCVFFCARIEFGYFVCTGVISIRENVTNLASLDFAKFSRISITPTQYTLRKPNSIPAQTKLTVQNNT